jgi:hypothetical protein
VLGRRGRRAIAEDLAQLLAALAAGPAPRAALAPSRTAGRRRSPAARNAFPSHFGPDSARPPRGRRAAGVPLVELALPSLALDSTTRRTCATSWPAPATGPAPVALLASLGVRAGEERPVGGAGAP